MTELGNMAATEAREYCMDCGNYGVVRKIYDGQPIDECEICGAMYGSPDIIEQIENDRDAKALGVNEVIFPLVRELDDIRGVRCYESHGGEPLLKTPPFVKFRIGTANAIDILESLMNSLTLSNRLCFGHWHIEVILPANQIAFELRPKLPGNPEMHEIFSERTRDDVAIIAKNLHVHKNLKWWKA